MSNPQLATATLNFGVGRSSNFRNYLTIFVRTPATQNFCQLLDFAIGLKSSAIVKLAIFEILHFTINVFFFKSNRVLLTPVACGAINLTVAAGGEGHKPTPPPGPRFHEPVLEY